MTKEQEKLIMDNMDIIDYVLYSLRTYFHDNASLKEEIRSVATEALCTAALTYNPEKGAFKPFAAQSMRWRCWVYIKSEFAHGMKIPIEVTAQTLKNKYKFVANEDTPSQFSELELCDLLESLRSSLVGREIEVLPLMLESKKISEIMKITNLCRAQVYNIRKSIQNKLKAILNEEMAF